MDNSNFRIRKYGRTELARLYSPTIAPESAWRSLRTMIEQHPTLLSDLEHTGYDHLHQRSFTPAQVELIVNTLGGPDE